MEKSKSAQKRIRTVRNRGKKNGKSSKSSTGRDINTDNLTDLERSILEFMVKVGSPVSVRDIATEMFGSDVESEGKGKESVRTIRNALRTPKAMDLITQSDGSGTYSVTTRFRKWGLVAAEKTAAAWKSEREQQRRELSE